MTDQTERIELKVTGMDCAGCVAHVTHAVEGVPGVHDVRVYLSAEKAVFRMDPRQTDLGAVRRAVEASGYSVPENPQTGEGINQRVMGLFGLLAVVVLLVVIVGEVLGVFDRLTAFIPWPVWAVVLLVGGFPVFRNVIQAALQRRVISHTLMTVGVIAAVAVGVWATAVLIVFFMRVGDYVEHFTTERARGAVRDLAAMAPQTARILRDGQEVERPVDEVAPGEVVIVRPGESIPVDGDVIDGQAVIDQAAITGESMPVEARQGTQVYAATIAQMGSLRIRATRTGSDSTFGRVIQLVEEAEAHRAEVQRIADKFSTYYLPVVAGVALLTFLIRGDALATAAVLVVACSCSFALATPIAMLASIGAGAKRGLVIKGGKYLETLARADVLLIDKTGTLTLGQPRITDVVAWDGLTENEMLRLAASAERDSEHPLAEAVRGAARDRSLQLSPAQDFRAMPGLGVQAHIEGRRVEVGSHRLVGDQSIPTLDLQAEGKTLLYVSVDGTPRGVLAAADRLRPEVQQAVNRLRAMGIQHIELLTGDNHRTAEAVAEAVGVAFRANLLPEDKIRIVKEYQAAGHTVVMVGDGVNDAPALAQADVGIALGTDIAIEAAHIALMRDDWDLVPQVIAMARRTMNVVRLNIGLTTVYNLAGLSLAALGFLPPILAAAAQSIPDIGILANSSRLLRQPER
ncbi:MAG: heavy metal translocating P-type ATPase [Anaerolineae bacterium]